MVTVHTRLDVDDRDGFREALIRAFSRRGMFPPDVRSMSESELLWKPPPSPLTLPGPLMNALRASGRGDEATQRTIAVLLTRFCQGHRGVLGLTADAPIAVRSFHHAVRLLGAELEHAQDIVCEVTQTMDVPVARRSKSRSRVRGGTTLVIRNDGRVRYAIAKELHHRRRQAQIDHAADHQGSSASVYCRGAGGLDLGALHRGY
jgi:hypothetical protein